MEPGAGRQGLLWGPHSSVTIKSDHSTAKLQNINYLNADIFYWSCRLNGDIFLVSNLDPRLGERLGNRTWPFKRSLSLSSEMSQLI